MAPLFAVMDFATASLLVLGFGVRPAIFLSIIARFMLLRKCLLSSVRTFILRFLIYQSSVFRINFQVNFLYAFANAFLVGKYSFFN